MQFIIEERDPATNSIIASAPIEIADLAAFCKSFDFELPSTDAGFSFELDVADMQRLQDEFGARSNADERMGRLRPRNASDALSYQIHAGRELLLMLEGKKPMAFFYYASGEAFDDICDQNFEAYVCDGTLMRRERTIDSRRDQTTLTYVVFTLPREAWRADALFLLKETGAIAGWCEAMERMEGTLLGYTPEQNDEHIRTMFRPRFPANGHGT